jgi:hypothetical protein
MGVGKNSLGRFPETRHQRNATRFGVWQNWRNTIGNDQIEPSNGNGVAKAYLGRDTGTQHAGVRMKNNDVIRAGTRLAYT